MKAPSLPAGRYFRMLMIGYFEGLNSERGSSSTAWIRCRCENSLRLTNRNQVTPIIVIVECRRTVPPLADTTAPSSMAATTRSRISRVRLRPIHISFLPSGEEELENQLHGQSPPIRVVRKPLIRSYFRYYARDVTRNDVHALHPIDLNELSSPAIIVQ